MTMRRAATLCGCVAALPLLIGCANRGGALGPQPAAVGALDAGPARIYAAAPGVPAAILVLLPEPGDILTADPRLWAAQGFDVVMPGAAQPYRPAADREAAVRHLIAQAQAMADVPIWLVGADPALEGVMSSLPAAAPGQVSGVVVTSTISGQGTCTERMAYSYSGGGAPKVSLSRSGDACPAGSAVGPGSGPAPVPAAPALPGIKPGAPRIIEASAANPAEPPAAVRQVAELIKSAPAD